MDIVIRENVDSYMKELKAWLAETADAKPEEMGRFFAERLEGYEEHMAVWKEAYRRFAGFLPPSCREVLDLGCGTGLELDEIWKRNAGLSVTGVDLCPDMLARLLQKHRGKRFHAVCEDYFQYDMGEEKWDAVISFESLHHFLPKRKEKLYGNIFRGLKSGAVFLLGDYIACCVEEEKLLRNACLERRKRFAVPEDCFVHFDMPLTLEHEIRLLREAGFAAAEAVESINGATIITALKLSGHSASPGNAADDAE